jgi:hypothetical protein
MASPFSERIRNHPRIAVTSSPGSSRDVLAVHDQLLVCTDSQGGRGLKEWVLRQLPSPHVRAVSLTSVFAGVQPPTAQDVDVLQLSPAPKGSGIFDIVRTLRDDLASTDNAFSRAPLGSISPNHVLVPAPSDDHSCPSGPPSPTKPGHIPPERRSGVQPNVVVIDSGYQWSGPSANPLDGRVDEIEAETIDPRTGQWIPGTPDVSYVPSANTGTRFVEQVYPVPRINALAGHANFIAGLIAQSCPQARITIKNHNGVFAPNSEDFPTEAAVARSLYQSAGADIVDLGFAFSAYDSLVSCAWDIALGHVGNTPVLAPVGNQGSTDRRYPAALHDRDYPNVISVGSLRPVGTVEIKSEFSNYGPWVACSARGEMLASTFLAIDGAPEDGADPLLVKNFTGWATWQGTSFATPQVLAAITNGISPAVTPMEAWANLKSRFTQDPQQQLGYILDKLP